MAQTYPYLYQGKQRMKQDKCRASIPLDRPRIWMDFNEYCADDEQDGAPIYLFSQADIVNDSDGNDVELSEALAVSVFDSDLDAYGQPDALLAEGVVIQNFLSCYPHVKWLVKLTKSKTGENPYVYWMSDLQ